MAKRLLEPEVTAKQVVEPARRRRPMSGVSRAPAVGLGKRIADVMVTDVVTVDLATSLLDAARLMRDANVGMLPVVDDGRLCGVITDRDLAVRAMAEGLAPGSVGVKECLSQHVVTAAPDWSTDQALETMALERVGRLPVVDGRGRVVGVVTLSSLALRSRDKTDTLDTAQEVSRRSVRRDPAA